MAASNGFGGMEKGFCGSGGAFRKRLAPSDSCCRLGPQSSQPDQVVRRAHEGEPPAHFLKSSQLHFPQQADRLHPAEGLFHALAFPLAERIAGVPGGAFVNGAGPARVAGELLIRT